MHPVNAIRRALWRALGLTKYLDAIDGYISDFAPNDDENINFGLNSRVLRPSLRIEGSKNIFIGSGTVIGRHAWLSAYEQYANMSYTPKLKIGNRVSIGDFACITAIDEIEIGDDCLISQQVYISDHSHGFDPSAGPPLKQKLTSRGPVKIGASSFLGYRVTVMSGVVLGTSCVVGAHSIVNKSFPSFSLIAGQPARLLKRYCPEKGKWIEASKDDSGEFVER